MTQQTLERLLIVLLAGLMFALGYYTKLNVRDAEKEGCDICIIHPR